MPRIFGFLVLLVLIAAPLASCATSSPASSSTPPNQNVSPGNMLPNGLTPEPWNETS
jgi:hypothetical protein